MSIRIFFPLLLVLFSCNDDQKANESEFFKKPLVTDVDNVVYNANFVGSPVKVNNRFLRFSEGVKVKKKTFAEVLSEDLSFKLTIPDFKAAIFIINDLPLEVPCYSNLKAIVNATSIPFLVQPSNKRVLPRSYVSLPPSNYTLTFSNAQLTVQLSGDLNCGVLVFGSSRVFFDYFSF